MLFKKKKEKTPSSVYMCIYQFWLVCALVHVLEGLKASLLFFDSVASLINPAHSRLKYVRAPHEDDLPA